MVETITNNDITNQNSQGTNEPTFTEVKGTTFIDQAPNTTAVYSSFLPQRNLAHSGATLSASPWTVHDLAEKYIDLPSFNIDTVRGVGEIAKFYEFPKDILSVGGTACSSNVIADQLARLAYFRANLKVKVISNTTQFDRLRLRFVWVPNLGQATITDYAPSNFITLPGAEFDAKESNTFEIISPWWNINPFLPTANNINTEMPRLVVIVLSPLIVPTGSGTQRIFDVKVSLANFEGQVPQKRFINTPASTYLQNLVKPELTFSNLDISDYLVPESFQIPVKRVGVTGLSSEPLLLGAHVDSCSDMNEVVETSQDELDMQYVLSKQGFYNSVSWTTSHTRGTLLFEYYAHPLYYLKSFPNYMAPMTYLSPCFQYFSGDLMMKLQINKNKFMRGKLSLVYIPNPANQPTLTADDCLNGDFLKTTYDIAEFSEITHRIPFLYKDLVCPVGSISTVPVNAPGLIRVYVQVPLISNDNTTSATLNSFISASDNFCFYEPRRPLASNLIYPTLEENLRDLCRKADKTPVITPKSGSVAEKVLALNSIVNEMNLIRKAYPKLTNVMSDVGPYLKATASEEYMRPIPRVLNLTEVKNVSAETEFVFDPILNHKKIEVTKLGTPKKLAIAAGDQPQPVELHNKQRITFSNLGDFGDFEVGGVISNVTQSEIPLADSVMGVPNSKGYMKQNAMKPITNLRQVLTRFGAAYSIDQLSNVYFEVNPITPSVGCLLAWVSRMYGYWQGSLRYLIVSDNMPGVLPTPGPRNKNILISHKSDALVNTLDINAPIFGYPTIEYDAAKYNNVCIEVPFVGMFPARKVKVSTPPVTKLNEFSNGVVTLYDQFSEASLLTNASVYIAAGSDFRLGCLLGAPALSVIKTISKLEFLEEVGKLGVKHKPLASLPVELANMLRDIQAISIGKAPILGG